MLQIKRMLIASIMGFCCMHGYALAKAEPSKQMRQFLAFDQAAQQAFIGNAVVVIGVVAAQTQPQIARCIDDWYAKTPTLSKQRKAEIMKIIRKYPQYTPSAVVLAVVEKACGKFRRPSKS